MPDLTVSPPRLSLHALWRVLRPYQWAKNGLVFLPLLTAHAVADAGRLAAALAAFAAFSLTASATYVVNDVVDRQADRLHPHKRHRPFASGALRPSAGYWLAPALLAAAFALSGALLPLPFAGVLALYVALTVAYSFGLKRVAMVDVLLLAGLYALRVFAGAVATGLPISEWLLLFSLFFFLSLAFLKRYAELRRLQGDPAARLARRGYQAEDYALIRAFGPMAGYLAVLVFAQYAGSEAVRELYTRPHVLWLAAPLLLYWTSRAWLLAHRGDLDDDPILFTAKDPASYLVGALVVAVVLAAGPL